LLLPFGLRSGQKREGEGLGLRHLLFLSYSTVHPLGLGGREERSTDPLLIESRGEKVVLRSNSFYYLVKIPGGREGREKRAYSKAPISVASYQRVIGPKVKKEEPVDRLFCKWSAEWRQRKKKGKEEGGGPHRNVLRFRLTRSTGGTDKKRKRKPQVRPFWPADIAAYGTLDLEQEKREKGRKYSTGFQEATCDSQRKPRFLSDRVERRPLD